MTNTRLIQESLDDILEDEPQPSPPLSPPRGSAPSKALIPPSRRKHSCPGITSALDRNYSASDSPGKTTTDISRANFDSPRRSSLFSPDAALADDEYDAAGSGGKVSEARRPPDEVEQSDGVRWLVRGTRRMSSAPQGRGKQ